VIAVELHLGDDVPESKAQRAVNMIASLDRYVDPTALQGARLTLRRDGSPTPFVADASVVFDGRVLAAHEAARSAELAADAVAQRLRRQLRSVVDATVALRDEPRTIEKALRGILPEDHSAAKRKPPEERVIVRRRPYSEIPISTIDAVADLVDMKVLFNLFRHVLTDEDVVVFVRDDGRIGLIHPQGSPLADENDVVIPMPSRYSDPLALEQARAEMDFLNHRFLYFTDADDGRGKVVYLRRDGDYGLVEPAGGTSTSS
jgi:ribosome-associated translation inhibitor RaiA